MERPLCTAFGDPALEFRRRILGVPPVVAIRIVVKAHIGAGLPVGFRHRVDLVVDFMIRLRQGEPPTARTVPVYRRQEELPRRICRAYAGVAPGIFAHHRKRRGRPGTKPRKHNGVWIDRSPSFRLKLSLQLEDKIRVHPEEIQIGRRIARWRAGAKRVAMWIVKIRLPRGEIRRHNRQQMAWMREYEGWVAASVEDAGLPEHLLEIGPLLAASRDVDDKRHRASARGGGEQERYE